ncbi:hypothetical protein MMS56_29215, partial [Escherichia coli]|nr:hypothetical protein [Escherichia coli]
ISVSVVNPLMLENGWTFDDSFPGATGDTLYQHEFLYQLYLHAVVNGVINPAVKFVNFRLQGWWVVITRFRAQRIKRGIKHAD